MGRNGGLNPNGNPARILDVLETDGGWLTTDGIAMRIGASKQTTDRALWRLAQKELVEHRSVELATAAGSGRTVYKVAKRQAAYNRYDRRAEWRTL